ncbi:MAG: DEAD/DEAH box helicase, partial [Bacteroidaceae bacterium]|nr:DEAD/DEAH box helicase [Bacteroidaceae bacterium]
MTLSDLSGLYGGLAQTKALIKELAGKRGGNVFLQGLRASSAPLLFSGLAQKVDKPCILAILNDQEEAAYFYHDMVQTIGDEQVLFFPSAYRRAVKYGQKDDASEILRTEVLSRLTTVEPDSTTLVIVTSPDALAEKVVSKSSLEDKSIQLHTGETLDREELQDLLLELGFNRVDYVYEPGQFALRGSILDVFSFSSEYPLRIDFFGDDIDSIRQFSVDTQLSTDKKESVVIVPDMDKVQGAQVSLMDFLPADTILAVKDMMLTADRMTTIANEVADNESLAARMRLANAAAGSEANAKIAPDGSQQPTANSQQLPSLLTAQDFLRKTTQFRIVEFGNKPTGVASATITFDTTPQPLFHKNFELVSKTLTDYIVQGYKIYILTDNPKQGDRLHDIFAERGENIRFITIGKTLHEGFADGLLKCCFFTDHQIFDRYHKYNLRSDRARNGKVALTLKELQEFQIGDYVVHMDHGVGKFGGLVRVPQGDGYQEKIKIIYKNDDVVFVSIHALHKVSKYKGKEGEEPHINKLGTGAWENLKERTKGKIKDIARDLIKLYAKRLEEKGFAYSPDSYLQNELEASFMYEDTPDQLKATQDVKMDMESSRPMDRLICGDVGFGKTEVAIRAAFKAVADNKQVAVLVPTTILAFQHYQTFRDRLKEFPCRVEYL